jgi:hypothetical protein
LITLPLVSPLAIAHISLLPDTTRDVDLMLSSCILELRVCLASCD